jgi:hypothetical protein
MINRTVALAACLVLVVACSKSDDKKKDDTSKDDKASDPAPKASAGDEAKPGKSAAGTEKPEEGTGDIEKHETPKEMGQPETRNLELVEFPNTKLDAVVDQYVFAPTDTSYESAHGDNERERFDFNYGQKRLVSIGDVESELYDSTPYKIPNAYLIPIPKEAEVAVGDIVVASKYGNSFDRAIVTKVGDKVEANFMQEMPFGDTKAEISGGRFYKLTEPFQPGAPVIVYTARKFWELASVVRVEGDRVLLAGHMDKMMAADKSAVIPVPLKLDAKPGDAVYAVSDTVHFHDGTLVKIDAALGHYIVHFENATKEKRVPFGEAVKGTEAEILPK